jgi:hypothetical protein
MRIMSPVRRHKTAAERAEIIASYERQWRQLSQRDFATQHGIALSTLQRWLRLGANCLTGKGAALIEVPNPWESSRPVGAGAYRLHLPQGRVLEGKR